ncbi:hypothetical protein [Actinoplanes sp. NPDC049599]|uniref:hypothetical protein n=1 Tax=Actinoplanes sp. NPDC049599 TaxID=3363903 RepID=UPI0037996A49
MVESSPSRLAKGQRLELAAVSGTGRRWTFGPLKDRPHGDAVAAVRAESTDPVVLGHAMGTALAASELDEEPRAQVLAGLYESAGADLDVAAAVLAWQRERYRIRGHR